MNLKYLTATILLLFSEFFLIELPESQSVIAIALIRILAAFVLCLWYFQYRKPLPTLIDKLFFLTLLLPVLISVGVMFSPGIMKNINIIIHAGILCLWAAVFRQMGAEIKFQGELYKFLWSIPIYALLPILFYVFSLHTSLPNFDKALLLGYTLIYIYTSTLASFLPIQAVDKFWIRWSVILMAFANLLVFYSIFVEKLPWLGTIPRITVILSRCILIMAMLNYFSGKQASEQN
ncbi:hypothetical protein [Emticicia soli]|uniref:EamA domain-containing protein n=1 Tax=Emticicia soli TaxID=2027878 RepID=A0ABW5J0Z7_9BACT